MIDSPIPVLTWTVVAFALGSVLVLLPRRNKSDAEVLFALFCGSVAMSMLRPWFAAEQGLLWWLVTLGSCATCNVYWLFSRALFRGPGGVTRGHVLVAATIAVMIVAQSLVKEPSGKAHWLSALVDGALSLASSTVLVLAFAEALRGWSGPMPGAERRLRLGFMAVYGGCLILGTTFARLAEASLAVRPLHTTVVTLCAIAVIAFTHSALMQRRRYPWPEPLRAVPETNSAPKAEDRALADALLQMLERDQVYREPELKVAELARRLATAEHKLSRVITQSLGERNFNQLINRYRIAHACRLLETEPTSVSVLDISMAAGFASLGPFNRAFKASKHCTPSAYRQLRRSATSQAHCAPIAMWERP